MYARVLLMGQLMATVFCYEGCKSSRYTRAVTCAGIMAVKGKIVSTCTRVATCRKNTRQTKQVKINEKQDINRRGKRTVVRHVKETESTL